MNFGLQGNLEIEENNIVEIFVKEIKVVIKNLLLENGIIIIGLDIEYFYDGEFTDLGIKVQDQNNITGEIKTNYISFIINRKILKDKLICFLSNFKENEKFLQLKSLAENIKFSLDKNPWFKKIEEITVSHYD